MKGYLRFYLRFSRPGRSVLSGQAGFSALSKIALMVLVFLLLTAWFPVRAQETVPSDTVKVRRVEILNADLLTRSVENGEEVRSLVGNVRLRQDSTDLWANQATQYVAREEILFEGDVQIIDRGDSLSSARVRYDSRNKIGYAEGDLRLADGEVELFAPSGTYFIDEKRSRFDEGVRLVDSTAVLTSRAGEYFSEEERAEFYEDVLLVEERTNLSADSVTYYRETEISLARGDVFIARIGGEDSEAPADSLVRTLLFGHEAYNDNRKTYSKITGDPLLVQLREDSTTAEVDTLVVRAEVLEASRIDSLDRLIAVGSVHAWQQKFAALADSLVVDRITQSDSTEKEDVRLFRQPIAWFQESQVTGDTLYYRTTPGGLDSLFAHQNAFVARFDSALARIHQIKGRTLVGTLRDDSLRMMEVGPNAELIYYLSNKEEQADGAVQTSADRIVFLFSGGELSRTSVLGQTEGTFYPEDLIPDQFELTGFLWVPENRPTREGLLDDERVRERLQSAPVTPAAEPLVTTGANSTTMP